MQNKPLVDVLLCKIWLKIRRFQGVNKKVIHKLKEE